MTAYDIAKESIQRHEGLRLMPYKDTVGKLTIGYGRNLDDRGVSPDTAEQMLDEDMDIALRDAIDLIGEDWWPALSAERQAVIWELAFQLGKPRLSKFVKMLNHARVGDHNACADELLASKWAEQVPARANELASRYRNGGA